MEQGDYCAALWRVNVRTPGLRIAVENRRAFIVEVAAFAVIAKRACTRV